MALLLVLLCTILAFSLVSTQQCVSSPGSSVDLTLHSHKNASGDWIITVDTRRLTRKDNPREFSVNVQHETRICGRYEIEEHVSMAFVYPSLHDTSIPGTIEPSATTTTAATLSTATATPSTATISTTTTATPPAATISTTTTATPPAATISTTTTATPPAATISTTTTTTPPAATISTSTTTTLAPPTATSTTTTTTPPAATISTTTTATPSTVTISTTTTATPPNTTTSTSTTTPKSCPHSGYQLYPEFSCYKAFREERTWSEARDRCVRDGGDLMVVESERERREVFIPLFNSVGSWGRYPWVGVYKPQDEDGWMSVNGEPALSTWWVSRYPVKNAAYNCAFAYSSGPLANYNCTDTGTFICEISL